MVYLLSNGGILSLCELEYCNQEISRVIRWASVHYLGGNALIGDYGDYIQLWFWLVCKYSICQYSYGNLITLQLLVPNFSNCYSVK